MPVTTTPFPTARVLDADDRIAVIAYTIPPVAVLPDRADRMNRRRTLAAAERFHRRTLGRRLR